MGLMVTAECACGFEIPMALGGGMSSFKDLAAFPTLCPACDSFDVCNLLEQPPRVCGRCGGAVPEPYDTPSLRGEAGKKRVFDWRVPQSPERRVALDDGTYKCPKCREFTLRFVQTGHWD